MYRTAQRARRTALAAAAAIVLVAGLGACTGSGPDSDDDDPAPGASSTPGIRTTATIGKVTGKLNRDLRAPLRKKVTATFDSWVDAAYLSSDGADAFAGFIKDARALAKKDGAQMSNAAVWDRVDSVTAITRKLSIEVLADKGRPAAVTGRFVLVLELDGQTTRTDRIAGRLFLRRGNDGWKIFGYEVKRGAVA